MAGSMWVSVKGIPNGAQPLCRGRPMTKQCLAIAFMVGDQATPDLTKKADVARPPPHYDMELDQAATNIEMATPATSYGRGNFCMMCHLRIG